MDEVDEVLRLALIPPLEPRVVGAGPEEPAPDVPGQAAVEAGDRLGVTSSEVEQQDALTSMRALLAGLFVFGGLLLGVAAVGAWLPRVTSGPLLGLLMAGWLCVLIILALYIFNRPGVQPLRGDSDAWLHDLEAKGQIVTEEYAASRAFAVEEFEDEGSHYFVELKDGSVLRLSGQYLYDYEPITDDPDLNQARRFPCTRFTVRRHRGTGDGIELICAGEVFEPECTAPAFGPDAWEQTRADGTVITDRTYDDLLSEHKRRAV